MDWTTLAIVAASILVYVATFKLAWRLLSRLVLTSMTRARRLSDPRFLAEFFLYRLVIAAPYAVLLLAGRHVPTTLTKILFWWVVLGLVLGLLRFVGTARTTALLWWSYGCVYDGLQQFYPYRHLVGAVVDRLDLRDGLEVLEVGCGTGNVIQACLQRNALRVVGVDNSSTMLARAAKKLSQPIAEKRVKLIRSDLLSYLGELPTNSIDRISLVNVLYAVQDREQLWSDVLRILRPSGTIVATTSDRAGSKSIIKEHFDNSTWRELLSLRLIGVAVIDYLISELAKSGPFSFPEVTVLLNEVRLAGGIAGGVSRIYGGDEDGVNVIFTVTKGELKSSQATDEPVVSVARPPDRGAAADIQPCHPER